MNCEMLISIIVPAYNVAQWLPRCVESIIAQTYTNWELLLIDDGSTDCTPQIVDRYAKQDSRIVAIHQENKGLVQVREKGIELAQGAYVGFVDGDDAVDPDMYERLLRNAIEYDADISHCGLCMYYGNGRTDPHYGTEKRIEQSSFEALRDLLLGEYVEPSLCNKLYRRELLIDSCLDKTIQSNEDLLRNFVLFGRAKKVVYEDFCGYQYWSRENSMSNDSRVIQRLKQVMQARACITEHASQEIMPYAKRTWLSSVIMTVNTLTFVQEKEAKAVCAACRALLKRHKKDWDLLLKRQRFAARLIVLSPTIHRWVYRMYLMKRRSLDA